VENHASALAFISWSASLETARKLHGDGYEYESDYQRIGVINELLAFSLHLCDRLAFDRLDEAQRKNLVNALGDRLAEHMQENLEQIAGPGRYKPPFIALLNRRMADYAQTQFSDGEPGFDFIRYLGSSVLEVMGDTQTNRWVIDQIMSVEAPVITEKIRTSFENLLDTG